MKDKRTLIIADDSNVSINITLWGDHCKNEFIEGDIVAFTQVRVSDYGGRSINSNASSTIVAEPQTDNYAKI